MTNLEFAFLPMKQWFRFNSRIVETHFASAMTLNNCEIIAKARSYIFRWLLPIDSFRTRNVHVAENISVRTIS